MPTLTEKQLEQVRFLYKEGLSVRELSEKFEMSLDAMFYIFRKHQIPRRSASERNQTFFERKANSFRLKNNLTEKEKNLKTAGIMLYWGEGSQWQGEKIVDFANSKPEMVKVFLAFLRQVCGIDEKKLRVYLYAYSDQDIKKITNFWSKLTNIPLNQFSKPYIREDYRLEKSGKMPYGLIHVRYYDKKLLLLILEWIKQYQEQY